MSFFLARLRRASEPAWMGCLNSISLTDTHALPACAAEMPVEPRPVCFAALDFETADRGRDSACALSIVRVENDGIVETWSSLIRPPRSNFEFTYLHGISWERVRRQPTFAELWPQISNFLAGAESFLVRVRVPTITDPRGVDFSVYRRLGQTPEMAALEKAVDAGITVDLGKPFMEGGQIVMPFDVASRDREDQFQLRVSINMEAPMAKRFKITVKNFKK